MQTTFSGFEAARQALMASQNALNITSQNIANASTPGYSRQRIYLTSTPPDVGGNKYMVNKPSVGQGVNISGIEQIRDDFLDVRFRSENPTKSMWDDLSNSLSQIEDIFNELGGDTLKGISGQLSTLLSNFRQLQTTPNDNNMSAIIRNSADSLSKTIRTDNNQLSELLYQIKSDLQITVDGATGNGGINAILGNISSLNQQIAVYEASGQSANELRDQRNILLDKLSGNADIEVTSRSNGMVTIALKNDSTHMLIDANNVVSKLILNASQTAVEWQDDSSNAIIMNGDIASRLQIINGDGTGVGTYGDLGIPAMQTKLDAFVKSFINIMNNVVPLGQALMQGSNALDIDTSNAWKADSSLLLNNYPYFDVGNYAAQFINNLSQQGTVTINLNVYGGTLQDFADSLSLDIANRLNYAKKMSSSSDSIVKNLDQQRQSVSSVSIDEEGINMIKYQHSYNAAIKVITVLDEMLETLIRSFSFN